MSENKTHVVKVPDAMIEFAKRVQSGLPLQPDGAGRMRHPTVSDGLRYLVQLGMRTFRDGLEGKTTDPELLEVVGRAVGAVVRRSEMEARFNRDWDLEQDLARERARARVERGCRE